MNIAFVTEKEICAEQGGTEHVTHTLSASFAKDGNKCYSLFVFPKDENMIASAFHGKKQIDTNNEIDIQIDCFLETYSIDFVIINLVTAKYRACIQPTLYKVAKRQHVKVITCYHMMPGYETKFSSWSHIFYRLTHRYEVKQALTDAVAHLVPMWIKERLIRKKYRACINNTDKLVLLSERYYEPFLRISGVRNNEQYRQKLTCIENSLSFNEFATSTDIKSKAKTALIVARLDEKSKNLSTALKIWKAIEKNDNLNDWSLDIAGDGPDMNFYKHLTKKLNLKRCHLLGRCPNPQELYKKAAVFIMTSVTEGFPLTLTESQQFGCVPVVFNSFGAAENLVKDGINGYLIKSKDHRKFIEALLSLMSDESKRNCMANAAIENSRTLVQNCIMKKWRTLMESMGTN